MVGLPKQCLKKQSGWKVEVPDECGDLKERIEKILNGRGKVFITGQFLSMGELYVSLLEIKKSYRRIGLGTSVIKEICNYAKENEYKVRLYPKKRRIGLIHFYLNLGFEDNGGFGFMKFDPNKNLDKTKN